MNFKRALQWSVGVHAAVLIFAALKALVFPGSPMLLPPTLRVDVVGLPDALKKDLTDSAPPPDKTVAKSKPASPEAEEKPDKDEMALKKEAPSKKKLSRAIDRLRALEKIRDLSQEAKPSAVIKGNRISKGTSLSGDARERDSATYYDLVRDRLHTHWSLPVWVARQELSAQVQLFIDPAGKLQNFRFTRPSGNPQFDDAVRQALQNASPFPPPPEGAVRNTLSSAGILVGFPL